MSGRITRRASIALLASLLQLIAGIESAMGLSLCIAEDGHTSLELAHADDTCALEVERHHPQLDEIDAEELAEHPCRDLNLHMSECGPGSTEPEIAPLVTANVLAIPDASDEPPDHLHEWKTAHDPPGALRYHTIVLLI